MGCWAFDFDGRPAGREHPPVLRRRARGRAHDHALSRRRLLGSLMGTVHETGHGRYEQNLPREWLGQPVAEARSMALHESQSLSFEMQLGSHPGFVARWRR
jgi:hypothetical protein